MQVITNNVTIIYNLSQRISAKQGLNNKIISDIAL